MKATLTVLSLCFGLSAHAVEAWDSLKKSEQAAQDMLRAQEYRTLADSLMQQEKCDGSNKRVFKACLEERDTLLSKRTAALARVETVSQRDEVMTAMIEVQTAKARLLKKQVVCASSVDCEFAEDEKENKLRNLEMKLAELNERAQAVSQLASTPAAATAVTAIAKPQLVKEERPAKEEKPVKSSEKEKTKKTAAFTAEPQKPLTHWATNFDELAGKEIILPGMYMLNINQCDPEKRIAYVRGSRGGCSFAVQDVDCDKELPTISGGKKPIKWRVQSIEAGMPLKSNFGGKLNEYYRREDKRVAAIRNLDNLCFPAPPVFRAECRNVVGGMGTFQVPDQVTLVAEGAEMIMTMYTATGTRQVNGAAALTLLPEPAKWSAYNCLQNNAFNLEVDGPAADTAKVQSALGDGTGL